MRRRKERREGRRHPGQEGSEEGGTEQGEVCWWRGWSGRGLGGAGQFWAVLGGSG